LLVLDALLHILVIPRSNSLDVVVGAVAGVVIGDDGLERGLFLVGLDLVVLLLLRQVFLNLLYVLVAFGRWREYAGDIERAKARVAARRLAWVSLKSSW
jgi:hypothetical protein